LIQGPSRLDEIEKVFAHLQEIVSMAKA